MAPGSLSGDAFMLRIQNTSAYPFPTKDSLYRRRELARRENLRLI